MKKQLIILSIFILLLPTNTKAVSWDEKPGESINADNDDLDLKLTWTANPDGEPRNSFLVYLYHIRNNVDCDKDTAKNGNAGMAITSYTGQWGSYFYDVNSIVVYPIFEIDGPNLDYGDNDYLHKDFLKEYHCYIFVAVASTIRNLDSNTFRQSVSYHVMKVFAKLGGLGALPVDYSWFLIVSPFILIIRKKRLTEKI